MLILQGVACQTLRANPSLPASIVQDEPATFVDRAEADGCTSSTRVSTPSVSASVFKTIVRGDDGAEDLEAAPAATTTTDGILQLVGVAAPLQEDAALSVPATADAGVLRIATEDESIGDPAGEEEDAPPGGSRGNDTAAKNDSEDSGGTERSAGVDDRAAPAPAVEGAAEDSGGPERGAPAPAVASPAEDSGGRKRLLVSSLSLLDLTSVAAGDSGSTERSAGGDDRAAPAPAVEGPADDSGGAERSAGGDDRAAPAPAVASPAAANDPQRHGRRRRESVARAAAFRSVSAASPPMSRDEACARARAAFELIDRHGEQQLSRRDVIAALRAPRNELLRCVLGLPQRIRQEDGTRNEFERVFQAIGSGDSKVPECCAVRAADTFYVRSACCWRLHLTFRLPRSDRAHLARSWRRRPLCSTD